VQTYAERAAWDFVENEKPGFDLVVINPPIAFGPVVHYLNSLDAVNWSNELIRDIIQGKVKENLPPTRVYLWVDVRDVALAHVRAIEVPEAGGQRFFTVGSYFTSKRIVEIIRESHPELESKLPSKDVLDDMPPDVYGYDNTKSIKILGLTYRTLEESVNDTVKSLLAIGA
jgi:nucleoside-diphosphate-sugar epimerase